MDHSSCTMMRTFVYLTFICFLLLWFIVNITTETNCDNIGETCHPGSRYLPIDVVYTWVNGSDDFLLQKVELYKEIHNHPSNNNRHENINIMPEQVKSYTGRSLLVDQSGKSAPKSEKDAIDTPFEISKECPIEGCIIAPVVVSSSYVSETFSIEGVQKFAGFSKSVELKYTIPQNAESSLLFIKFSSILDARLASGKVITSKSLTVKFKPVYYSWQHGDGPFVKTSSKMFDVSLCNMNNLSQISGLLSYDDSEKLLCIEKDFPLNLQSNCAVTFPETYLVWPPWEKYMIGQLSFSDVGAHRFADNEELKYSLRSLYKFAPWIRNIYILTNGQIPKWLNIDNKRIKIVTHSDIFQNKSHLPTFSSPAIEANIHNIPGISEHFLYLNDDVLFGKPVYPEDFISTEGYKVFLAWNIPNCNTGCPPNWLTDGYCDLACNVTACNFDGGDCTSNSQSIANVFNNLANNAPVGASSYVLNYCNPGCSPSWVGDKYCDPACNVYNCGFDAGDCGTKDIQSKIFDVKLKDMINNTHIDVPPGIPAMYINVTLFNDSVLSTSYETMIKSQTIIRTSVLSLAHKIVSLTFFPNKTEEVTFTFLSSDGQHVNFNFNSSLKSPIYEKPIASNSSNKSEIIAKQWNIPQMKKIIFKDEYEKEINIIMSSLDSHLMSEEALKKDSLLQKLVKNGLLTEKGRWVKLGQFIKQKKVFTVPQRKPKNIELIPQRHILDSFADSLHHVDNLYTSHFGKQQRKVISHMPFLVNTTIINDLHSRFPIQFNKTSSNRFRSSDDMQFAFSYFYFIIHTTHKQRITTFLDSVDTNGDNKFSRGELQILMSHLFDLPVTERNISHFWENIENCSNQNEIGTLGPQNIHHCSNLSSLVQNIMKNITTYPHEIVDDKDVTFKMLKSNSTKVRIDLDYIRRNPKKFICLNDNMDHGNSIEHSENIRQLAEFYQTMFPNPSPFEHILPGKENKFLYKYKYKTNSFGRFIYLYVIFYVMFAIVLFYSCYLKRRTVCRISKNIFFRFF